jgi:hypothetical protein
MTTWLPALGIDIKTSLGTAMVNDGFIEGE